MTFALVPHETPAEAVRRLLTEQVDIAIDALQNTDENFDEAVHEARKSFKRVRAIFRLIRGDTGEAIYKRENVFFRDLGREFSGARDSLVLIETLDEITDKYADHLKVKVSKSIRQHLVEQYEAKKDDLTEEAEKVEAALEQLQAAKERISHLILEHEGFGAFKSGLKKIYGDGRDAMKDAYKNPSPDAFHEWRKDVKYLWHHMEIMTPTWEVVVGEYADELHQLADYLGKEHDYAVLQSTLLDLPAGVADVEAVRLLNTVLDAERERLQKLAKPLAKRLYVDKKKAFARRLDAYWHAWERENERRASTEPLVSPA